MTSVHAQARTSPDPMAATLIGEAAMPAICFRLNGAKVIEEGVKLELDHPKVGGKPAMFIGEYFILRNFKYGAAYDKDGVVRRAIVEYVPREGRKDLDLLSQPKGPNPPLLLHVDTSLPLGYKPKEVFWTGVDTDCNVLACSGKETLVSFAKDGEDANVFYADGSVVRVLRVGNTLALQRLTIEEQAACRLEMALWDMCAAGDQQDPTKRCPREDGALHQMIAVLAIGGVHSRTVFDQAYDLLKGVARVGDMRPRVLEHMRTVLRERFPDSVMGFEDLSLASRFAVHPQTCQTSAPTQGRGTPAERKKYLADRAQRDRQARAAMRGSSADKSLKGKGGKNKKK